MLTHSHLTRRHRYHLDQPTHLQNPDGRLLYEEPRLNGRLRLAVLKNNVIDILSQWLARLLPRQVILFATIQVWAAATTDTYSDNDLTVAEAISRWQQDSLK